jgi:hypothetical protein
MRNYSKDAVFSTNDLWLLQVAEVLVSAVPDSDFGVKYLRCHEVARAVGNVLDLPVQDGRYHDCQHTWLWTTCNEASRRILDVYCVGSLPQVQLRDMYLHGARAAFHCEAYKAEQVERNDIIQPVLANLIEQMQHTLSGYLPARTRP